MILPDIDTNRAFKNLSEVPDFARVLRWIEQSKAREMDSLLSAHDPVRVHQLQGTCRALEDILRAVRSVNPALPAHLG